MNVSYRWLAALLPDLAATPEEIAATLALRGAPVEGTTSPARGLEDLVVGRVIQAGPHPNADRLSLCVVDGGEGEVPVVCGAPNIREGAFYPFAPVGAVLPGDFEIKEAKIRGERSVGMLCSAKELGLGADHAGILEVPGEHTPGTPFVEAAGLDDVTLDVEITANRGDLLSHVGVARELADADTGAPALPAIPGTEKSEAALEYRVGQGEVTAGPVTIRVEDPELCPRYLGAVIRGVEVKPSPPWLQARLRGAGARPINNVVDATNYVMLELGQPLHAFDLEMLADGTVLVRTPTEDESSFVTLDDEERTLEPGMLLICDAGAPVGLAGVMGGADSEVGDETTDVLLECALFDPARTRATRRTLQMSTDASYRFERGVDPHGQRQALERTVEIILATAGGSVDGPVLDVGGPPEAEGVLELRLARIEHLLGVPLSSDRVEALLAPLGFVVTGEDDGVLTMRIPGWRSYDVTREVDLIEEVARTHGYDAFPQELGAYRPNTVPDHPLFQLEDDLRDLLVARGLLEAQTPAFVPADEGEVRVLNPVSTTEPALRGTLLPSLVRRAEYNLARGTRDVRLFELGTGFSAAGSGEAPREEARLAAVLVGRRTPPHWSVEDEPWSFWDLKGLLGEVAGRAWGPHARVEAADDAEGSWARDHLVVRVEGTEVARGGRLRPEGLDVPPWAGPIWALETTLPADGRAMPERVFRALPTQPASERDLALLVPRGVEGAAVLATIRAAGGIELEEVTLFDLYEGEGIPEDTRSMAFALRFRARDRTLKDAQVDGRVDAILEALKEEYGARQRG